MNAPITGVIVTYNIKEDSTIPLGRKLEYVSHLPAPAAGAGKETADETALATLVAGNWF